MLQRTLSRALLPKRPQSKIALPAEEHLQNSVQRREDAKYHRNDRVAVCVPIGVERS
jgi:hypothetical protein